MEQSFKEAIIHQAAYRDWLFQSNELALELTRRERFTLLSMLWSLFYRYLIDISALAYRLSRDSFARDHNLFSALVNGS